MLSVSDFLLGEGRVRSPSARVKAFTLDLRQRGGRLTDTPEETGSNIP